MSHVCNCGLCSKQAGKFPASLQRKLVQRSKNIRPSKRLARILRNRCTKRTEFFGVLGGPHNKVWGPEDKSVIRSHFDNHILEIHGRPPSGETAPRPASSGERLPKSALASALVTERKDWYSVTKFKLRKGSRKVEL